MLFNSLFIGNTKLFLFWVSYNIKLFCELPSELINSNSLKKRMETKKAFVINTPKSVIDKYNQDLDKLSIEIASLHSSDIGAPLSFKMRQIVFFIIRLFTIIAVLFSNHPVYFGFLISLFQFILLPYSLFVCIGYGIETSLMLFSGHIIVFPIIKYSIDLLFPKYLNISIPFSPLFIIIFLIIDHIFCILCLYKTPKGVTAKISVSRIWESVWYGFLNCKTYFLVLIPLLFGHSIPLTVWIIDAVLGISSMINNYIFVYWEFLFYHVHRMAHINYVYPDAHKFHHYLTDSTSFDAHLFGAGAPEEWLMIIIEYLIAVKLCIIPPSLSYWVLTVPSWYDKWGFHSRNNKPKYNYQNFHVDHHTLHNKNFGFEYPLEMVMNTTWINKDLIYKGFKLKRVEQDNVISLQFTPCTQS